MQALAEAGYATPDDITNALAKLRVCYRRSSVTGFGRGWLRYT